MKRLPVPRPSHERADRVARASRGSHRRAHGFTLIEAIVVIMITGIIAAMIGTFMRAPIDAYVDTTRRGLLTDAADTALRRIARDVRMALPNSLHVPGGPAACIEFLPTVGGGHYRVGPDSGGGGNPLNFNITATTPLPAFDYLAPNASIGRGNMIAVYNLGDQVSGADAYKGDTVAAIASVTATTITPAKTGSFPLASPENRFQVLAGSGSTVYLCTGAGQLALWSRPGVIGSGGAGELTACPASLPAGAAILSGNVSACSFNYLPGVTGRSGLLTVKLALTQGGETVTLVHEVHVDNVP